MRHGIHTELAKVTLYVYGTLNAPEYNDFLPSFHYFLIDGTIKQDIAKGPCIDYRTIERANLQSSL